MSEPNTKPKIEIEAPSREQVLAAKKMRRERQFAMPQVPSESQQKQRRTGVEGVVLILVAVALLYFLHPLGTIAWILAACAFFSGVIVMLRGWQ
jgi:hypothetical protein